MTYRRHRPGHGWHELQWGRPFHGRMTSIVDTGVTLVPQLQWGRPFHGRMTRATASISPKPMSSLQWGRPFHGRMTRGQPGDRRGWVHASMGPAVSRPDDGTTDDTAAIVTAGLQWGRPFHGRMTRYASGARHTRDPLQWGRPFHGRMTLWLAGRPGSSRRFNGAGRFTAG